MDEIESILYKLSRSKFRSSFHLNKKMKEYTLNNGYKKIKSHAEGFLVKRLKPSNPINDGKQTPMRQVHPVFIAQHATACCCRGCLEKWYKIPKGIELTDKQINFLVSVVMKWIEKEVKG